MRSTIKKLSIDLLTIDPLVQRVEGVDMTRVNRYAENFQPHQLGTFVVSQRPDGTYVVLDGMHRLFVCRRVNHKALVDAEVFSGLTIADEATLFLGRNDAKMPSALSKFHARVLMGDQTAIDITEIASSHGWSIGQNAYPGVISAVDALESVFRNGAGVLPDGKHPDLLSLVLGVITTAWEWDRKSADGAMLKAVAQLFARVAVHVDQKKLISEMQATRPGVLIGKAKTLCEAQNGTVPAALAKVLVGLHNNRRRTNLIPEWIWVR